MRPAVVREPQNQNPEKGEASARSANRTAQPAEARPKSGTAASTPRPSASPESTASGRTTKGADSNSTDTAATGSGRSSSSSPAGKTTAKKSPAKYPYDLVTKWGTVTVRSPEEEPKKLPNGDPDIEEPDAKGNIGWVTDKDMVARSRLTHEQIAQLKKKYPVDGSRIEESNKRNGTAGIVADLDLQAELVHLGVEPDEAARIADEVAKKGTGKAKDDAINDAMDKQNISPAFLKDTGRSPSYRLRLTELYQRLGGTDPSQMSPEFVNDVESAKRKGNVDAVLQKWNDKLGVASSPLHRSGGVSNPPSLTGGSAPAKPSGANAGGGAAGTGGAPPSWTSPFGQSGSRPSSAGGTGGRSSGSTGSNSGSSQSERSKNQAEQRMDRLDGRASTPHSSKPASDTTSSPAQPAPATAAPVWRTGNVSGGDEMTVTNEPPEDTASPGESEESNAEVTPTAAGKEMPRPDTGGDGRAAPGSWKKGFRPGTAEAIEGAAPRKGGEKVNPGEQGSDNSGARTGGVKSSTEKEHELVGNPTGVEPQPQGPLPAIQRGPNPNAVDPGPDAPDTPGAPVPGDTEKMYGDRSERGDGTEAKQTGRASTSPSAQPRTTRPKSASRETPTPTPPGYHPHYMTTIPTLTPPNASSPTPTATATSTPKPE